MVRVSPLDWLRAEWARITGLSARLTDIIEASRAIYSDRARPGPVRQRAARIWADALQDRAAVRNLLAVHVRESAPGLRGLGAGPVVLVVAGITAAAAMATIVAVYGRASAYERELDLLASGSVTVAELDRIRDRAPDTGGGVAATIREAGSFLKLAAVVAAGVVAFKAWKAR